jgi:hypothetical protein
MEGKAAQVPVSLRLNSEDLSCADAIGRKLGLKRTAVIKLAIRRLAELEQVPCGEASSSAA